MSSETLEYEQDRWLTLLPRGVHPTTRIGMKGTWQPSAKSTSSLSEGCSPTPQRSGCKPLGRKEGSYGLRFQR